LSTAPSYALDQTDTNSFTVSWLGQTVTYKVIPKEYPGDAENIPGFQTNSVVGGGTGVAYMSSYTSNYKYDASLFDGSNPNYDASVGGTPSGDYVDIYHIDKATADALLDGINGIISTGGLQSSAAVVSPDGDALAANNKTDKSPYTSLPYIYQDTNTRSSFPADSTDEFIVANSQAGTYGVIENSDGTITVYVNHGSLQEAHPATPDQIKHGLVFNNDPDGLENATAVYTNPAYSSTTSATGSGFQLIFADPTVHHLATVTTSHYSSIDGLISTETRSGTSGVPQGASAGQSVITVHYQDEDGNTLQPNLAKYGWAADNEMGETATPDLSIMPPAITGYTYESVDAPGADADGSATVAWPSDAGKTDVIYIYKANPQKVVYNVIDDTTGETLPVTDNVFEEGTSNGSLTKTQEDLQTIADSYQSQGYDIAGVDPVPGTFDTDDATDQVVNIHLTHHQTTATTTQEVTRTIHYVYENGDPAGTAAPDMPQKVTFTHTVVTDDVTGDPVSDTWTPDSDSFASVDSPEITNYTPDQTSVAGVSDLTYASIGQDVTVTYTANTEAVTDSQEVTRTIHYVYEDGSPVGEAAPDLTETATFTRTGTKNLATGKTAWDEWTSDDASFDEITSPSIAGYTPDKPVVEASTVAAEDDDITETVTYKADTQKIIYTVIDDTTGENLEENIDFDKGSTSDACTRGQDDLQGIADGYKDKGYDIVSVDTLPKSFDADTATDQIVYIHLSHATENSQESKEVDETIHYVYEDGTEAAPDKTDKVTFTRTNTTDKVTGEVIASTDWVAENDDTTFDAVTSPEIDGYTADKPTVDAVTDLTADSGNTELTVTYKKDAEEPAPPSEPTDDTPTTPSSTPKATLTVQPTSQTTKKSVLPSTGDEERSTVAVAGGLAVLGAGLLGVIRHLRRKKQ
ncbi:mucin-binding protein, partial [Lactovum odontotermitis]